MSLSIIYCQCNCGNTLEDKDKSGRPHKFIHGHQSRNRKYDKDKYNTRRNNNHYNYKNGFKVVNGYKLIRAENHPKANPTQRYSIPEHRLVYEQHNKCCLLPFAVIHHLDGNKRNNDPSNLIATFKHIHVRYHPKERDTNGRFIQSQVCNGNSNGCLREY